MRGVEETTGAAAGDGSIVGAALEPGARVYAVGDIHGRDDLLGPLLRAIEEELTGDPPPGPARVVFLGDYIDRGPGSRQVVDRLLAFRPRAAETIFLKGNHEAVLLDFLEDARVGGSWADYGGIETLASYGVGRGGSRSGVLGWEQARRDLTALMPDSHRRFFVGLRTHAYFAPFLFAHAGVDPEKPLAQQTTRDFLWIREHFLRDRRPLPFIVVHGHTPVDKPHVDCRRIGVDTGAHRSGVLTAARIEARRVVFLSARGVAARAA